MDVPAYERSWNLPAMNWIASFSAKSTHADSMSAKRSLLKVSTARWDEASSVFCVELMSG